MPGPSSVTRSAMASARDVGIDHDVRLGRRMHDGVGDDISDRLLDQRCIGPHQRQIVRQIDLDALARAVPPRRTDHALGDFSQVDPVPPQFQRARIDAGDRQKIADHFVEVFGLLLDLAEQILFRRRVELVAVVDQAGGRAEDRRQGRAEIVRDRCQQCVAHALRFGGRSRAHHFASKRGALSAAAVCSTNVSSKARASESSGGAVFLLGNADDAERLRADPQRHEIPRDDRQRAGVGAGRLVMAVGPARRGHGGGIERILGRPGRA